MRRALMMAVTNTIRNYFLLFLLYINSWINSLKVKLGVLKVKYGLVGHFEKNGIIWSRNLHTKRMVDAAIGFTEFKPDDVILAAYPKAGTNFTVGIIMSIYKEKGLIAPGVPLVAHALDIEMKPPSSLGLGIRRADNTSKDPLVHITSLQSPRILKTHLSWDILSSNIGAKAKIIHCIRNPKDVVCSYYSFLHKLKLLTPDTTWNRFFDYFINGNVLYGSYTSYMRKWYPYRNLANVLNIQFEDMKENLENNVREIAQFLDIDLTKEQITRISKANTFDHKKREAGKGHVLYRLGKSGGWKAELTVEQNEVMDEWINTELDGMEDLKLKYGE